MLRSARLGDGTICAFYNRRYWTVCSGAQTNKLKCWQACEAGVLKCYFWARAVRSERTTKASNVAKAGISPSEAFEFGVVERPCYRHPAPWRDALQRVRLRGGKYLSWGPVTSSTGTWIRPVPASGELPEIGAHPLRQLPVEFLEAFRVFVGELELRSRPQAPGLVSGASVDHRAGQGPRGQYPRVRLKAYAGPRRAAARRRGSGR